MAKFSVSATELSNTDVNFVALVKRGANRIPFRITKGVNEMLDLYSLGRRLFKQEEERPTIVAAIVQKGADIPAIAEALKSVGVDVCAFEKSEKGGIVTLARKSDEAPEDVVLVKSAGGVALAISNVAKTFQDHDFLSPEFGEVHSKGTHMASMSNATDSLHHTLGNIMQNSSDPNDACDKMGKACDDYKAHITGLTSKLPQQAFKADQALLKAEVNKFTALLKAGKMLDMRKHPHAGVALAIAHAAHAAASTAGQAADMLANGGGEDDQQTGPLPGQNNNASKAHKGDENIGEGDVNAEDPLMPKKNPRMTSSVDARKADAGKNGTGAGFELGDDTGTTDSATSDDEDNTEVNAKPGGRVSGNSSGMPSGAMAPTSQGGVNKAENPKLAIFKAQKELAEITLKLAKAEADPDWEEQDDDSTNGAQSKLPPKAKSPTTKAAITTDVTTEDTTEGHETQAGEGAAQAVDHRDADGATSDDAENAGGKVAGKVKGRTLSLDGVPAKAISPTTKNDGDADIGKKGKGDEPDETLSGAGAQQKDAVTMKADAALMRAIQALSKSVQDSLSGVTESLKKTNSRVEQVAAIAQKTDAALNGTVLGEAGDDNVRTMKSERAGAPPLLDTAYSRRTA